MPPSTFSIVAHDARSGEWGVAVQSKFPAVGALAAWADAGVGAIATQSFINVSYGEHGLRLLSEGRSAQEVVDMLTASDPGRAERQLGVVDQRGEAACFTGPECVGWCGDRIGPGYAAQGNMLVSGATLDALAERFERGADLPLAQRLVASLAAAQAAGGDRRGQQSSALRVVKAGAGYGGSGILVDLRVDDHRQPISELRRLLALHERHFGETPAEDWLPIDEALAAELTARLAQLGHAGGDLARDLYAWAGVENLELRVRGAERIDPIVLVQLRRAADHGESAHEHKGDPRDVEEIQRVHRQWWAANRGLDIKRMQECFAPEYLMWNLNGHPYYSLDEKVTLFRYYQDHLVPTEWPEVWDDRVVVVGDVAYLTAEGILPVVASGAGSGSATLDSVAPLYERRGDTVRVRFRETVVFRRDDGHGNPLWRIWHFHCSPLAPEDEPRPGFGDPAAEREHTPVEVMSTED